MKIICMNSLSENALLVINKRTQRALAKINYLHTGYVMDKLLDVHIVTDKDIQDGNSFAIKNNSVLAPATSLRIL